MKWLLLAFLSAAASAQPVPFYSRSQDANQDAGAGNANLRDITGRRRDNLVPTVGNATCLAGQALLGATQKDGYIFGGTCSTVFTSTVGAVSVNPPITGNGLPASPIGLDSTNLTHYVDLSTVTTAINLRVARAGDTMTGVLNVSTSVYIAGPNPWYDFTAPPYSAVDDGITNNDIAWARLYAVLPSTPVSSIIYFPHKTNGVYLLTNLVITDKNVTLKGDGGTCAAFGGGATSYPCASVIKSTTTTGPIVKWTALNHANVINTLITAMQDIAVQGSGTNSFAAKNSQDCIQVDQQGLNFMNVSVNYCGGNGWSITDSVSGKFYNAIAASANGHGVYLNDSGSLPNSSVNDNSFFGLISIANAGDGFHIARDGQGTKCIGCLIQSNSGYALNLSGEAQGASAYTSMIDFSDTWTEVNGSGSIHFSTNANSNNIHFTHMGDSATIDSGSYGNTISANLDVSNNFYDGENFKQIGALRNGYGENSSDTQATKIRSANGGAWGIAIGANFSSTAGGGDVFASGKLVAPSTLPYSGAFNTYNGQGLVSSKASGVGSYTVVASNAGNGVSVGGATGNTNIVSGDFSVGNSTFQCSSGVCAINTSVAPASYGLLVNGNIGVNSQTQGINSNTFDGTGNTLDLALFPSQKSAQKITAGVSTSTNAISINSGGGLNVSAQETVVSTLTVQGNKFSVGGSSFSVTGGSATIAYGLTAGNSNLMNRATIKANGSATTTTFSVCLGTATITTVGSPVMITLSGDASNNTINDGCSVWILQDGAFFNSELANQPFQSNSSFAGGVPSPLGWVGFTLNNPSAGSHSWCFGIGARTGGTCSAGSTADMWLSVMEVK